MNPYDTTPPQLYRAHAQWRWTVRLTLGLGTILCFLAAFFGGPPA